MKRRQPKPNDQENATRACSFIAQLVKMYPDIDCNCWISACLSSVASTFEANGIDYPQFVKEMEKSIKFYKSYWESGDNTTK